MIEIPCHCGYKIESEIETEIDLSVKADLYSKIIEGDFLTFTCPECGNDIKAETQLHLFDKENNIDILFIPELERSNYLSGQITADTERVVIGYRELVEKITISGSGLDDRIIEIVKFRLLEKADSDNITIFLNSVDDENLVMHIHGLKPDSIGITKVSRAVYSRIEEQIDALLEDEDIRLFTDGPYVSVSRIYLED